MQGCCPSEGEEAKHSKVLSKFMRDEKKKFDSEVKLLLLGAGESGKSTVAKQMIIIHLRGFIEVAERITFRPIVFTNIMSSIRVLLRAVDDLAIALDQKNIEARKRTMGDENEYIAGPLTRQQVQDIKELWGDAAIQTAYARSSEFQLSDSAAYYLNAIERIGSEGWVPNEQDILRSRARTAGIVETEFDVQDAHFRMVDVGGQRSERKKWIHCFQDVTAVIFCVAMSEYDLKLYEDDAINRMQESLRLFKEICNSEWFRETAMILFLNKRDLFEEKIVRVNLSVCFPDYHGGKDYTTAMAYITQQFLAQNENSKKPIYPHVTCATDTANITVVFNAVKDIVLRKALDNAGIV